MKVILSPSLDPYFNLALEEVLFNKTDSDYILLWRGRKSVVIGRNQNPFEETNLDYLEREGIVLARRISGGGAVFHDQGNINYTMILNSKKGKFVEFSEFMEPIVDFLKTIGLDTYITERNDMRYEAFKISGTAQYAKKERILHHGTLLFDANQEFLSKSLRPKNIAFESNAIKSVRSKVINLKKVLSKEICVEDFILQLKGYFIDHCKGINYELTKEDRDATAKLVNDKYSTWEWIIGYTPAFKIKDNLNVDQGSCVFNLLIKNGKVKEINVKLNGELIETNHLVNQKYSKELISKKSSNALNQLIERIV